MFNKFKLSDPINGVYLMHSIKSLASALIGIYVPIYFLKLGYGLTNVFIYWLVYGVCVFLFCAAAAFISNKIGLKKIVIVSVFLQFLYLYLLHRMGAIHIPIYFVAILSGLQAAFYWFPINNFFAKHSDEKKMGQKVGQLIAWPKILSLPEPILAGLVIIYFGFNYLFLVSGVLYLIALIPLINVPEIYSGVTFDVKNYWGLFKNNKRYFGAEFLENIREEMEAIVVPIFIFVTFASVLSVGIIGTVADLGAILFTLVVGKLTDTTNKRTLMKFGTFIMIFCWLARYFIQNQLIFYIASLVVGFTEILVLIPFNSIVYENAKKNHPAEFLLFREVAVGSARVFVYIIMIFSVGFISKTFALPIASLFAFSFY